MLINLIGERKTFQLERNYSLEQWQWQYPVKGLSLRSIRKYSVTQGFGTPFQTFQIPTLIFTKTGWSDVASLPRRLALTSYSTNII